MSTAAPTSERDQVELRSTISEIFGERAALAHTYANLLITDGIERGVLGPREADRVWPRHMFNSAALAGLLPVGARVVDLGSGAGLPGIPLALARPDLTMVLLEPMQRRASFLRDCLAVLDLPRVEVVVGRAEGGIVPLADVVVARAVAALERLVILSFELLADNGMLLALKGSGAAGELERVSPEIAGCAELLTVSACGEAATVIRVIRPPRALAGSTSPATKRSRRAVKGSR